MDSRPAFFPVAAVRRLFGPDGLPVWGSILVLLSIAALQSIGILAGSYVDGTLFLPDVGDGFFEHYGVWAILISDPLLLIAAGLAYRRFLIAFDNLPLVQKDAEFKTLERLMDPHMSFLNMSGRSKHVYFLLVATGFLCWLNNLRQTIDPVEIYGNDVFDSAQYYWGYYANKLNLFNSWVVVYPLVGFMLVSMSVSTRRVLMSLVRDNSLKPNVLHPDGCYGMLNFGLLNASLLVPYLLSYGVIFALLITHETTYFSVMTALVGLTITMLVASFVTIGPITGVGRKVRDDTYEALEEKSKSYNGNRKTLENRFAFERICFASARASPYSKWLQTIVNGARVLPVIMTSLKLFT